jgi:hypothetical protein
MAANAPKNGFLQKLSIVRHPRRFENQGWVGGCVGNAKAADRVHISATTIVIVLSCSSFEGIGLTAPAEQFG